ncbi:MAG: cation transporter [Anaerolineaceae bacterium]|nr:cation transporter [Anaerolineaceae bacterium]
MKKVYKLRDLDCANCAAKMEANIKKIPGVTNASVNFMMQKLAIESDTDDFDALMKEVTKVISKVEPDCEIIFK